ncbi:four helix bundle protein [Paenibacillus lactis]|uniref:four helix bundle protein n=1 Tax=Paenibacillus lactis TaxID=228574 RepID=UPI00369E01B6
MLRSSTSVVANIVEGNVNLYLAKEVNFLNNSLGSAGESQFWLEEARNTGLIDQKTFERLDNEANEIRKMLVAMIKKVKAEIEGKKRIA